MVKYGESYIKTTSTSQVTAKAKYKATTTPYANSKLRTFAYVNASFVILDATDLASTATILVDASKYREIKSADCIMIAYSNIEAQSNNIRQLGTTYPSMSRCAISVSSSLSIQQFYANIFPMAKMGTNYIEGHVIRFETTDGFVYDPVNKIYSRAKTYGTFKVPYVTKSYMSSLVTYYAKPTDFTKANADIQSEFTYYTKPTDFTKANASIESIITYNNGDDTRIRFVSSELSTVFTMTPRGVINPGSLASFLFSLITMNSSLFRIRRTLNNNQVFINLLSSAKRTRGISSNLGSLFSIVSSLSGVQRFRSNMNSSYTLIGDIKKRTAIPINPMLSNFTLPPFDLKYIRFGKSNMTSTNTISATPFKPWGFVGDYDPGTPFTVSRVFVNNDYSLVYSTSTTSDTTRKLELIDTSTRTFVRTFTPPADGRILYRNTGLAQFPNTHAQWNAHNTQLGMSTSYVACITRSSGGTGSSFYVEIFNKSTGAHIRSINPGGTEIPLNFTLTDNIIAIAYGSSTNDLITFSSVRFYQMSDGAEITANRYTPTYSPLIAPVSNYQGKFIVYDDWINNYRARIYDITGSTPSYIERNFRDNHSVVFCSPTYYGYFADATNSYALTNGTRPISYDINNLATVTTSRQPEIANYPLTPIASGLAENSFYNVAMNDQYIFTSVQGRSDIYITRISDLKKLDTLIVGAGSIIQSITDEYIYVRGATAGTNGFYQNLVN